MNCNGKTRSAYTCGNPNPYPASPPTCWDVQGTQPHYTFRGELPFVIQTKGPIPSGTKFYVSFWVRPHYKAVDIATYWNNALQVQSALVFTVP